MHLFRLLLVALFVGITAYTGIAVSNEGADLVTPFFGNLIELGWVGQFCADFCGYLLLSGVWVAWRNEFSPKGIALGGVASVFGIMFFAPYVLYLSYQANGDPKLILLGSRRSRE